SAPPDLTSPRRRRPLAAAISRGGFQGGSRTPISRCVSAPPDLVRNTSGPPRCYKGRMDGGGIDVDALYQKYGPMVLRRCRRILGDDDEALDVMQEVFVRVWTHRETLDVKYPSSLLFRIATNLSLNRLRDRQRRPSLPGDEVLEHIAGRHDLDAPLLL